MTDPQEKETPQTMEAKSYTLMTAAVYDAIYSKKNYEAKARTLKGLVDKATKLYGDYRSTSANTDN